MGHVFLPLALTGAVFVPVIGDLMDRGKENVMLPTLLLGVNGILTACVTIMLCFAGTPFRAVSYAFLRGVTDGIFGPTLNSGLAFAAFGVDRRIIGRALGINRLFLLAGTGTGPLVYGIAKDLSGSFRQSLQATSLPPFLLGLYFFVPASRARRTGGATIAREHRKLRKGYIQAESKELTLSKDLEANCSTDQRSRDSFAHDESVSLVIEGSILGRADADRADVLDHTEITLSSITGSLPGLLPCSALETEQTHLRKESW